jgi:hypothetical protein
VPLRPSAKHVSLSQNRCAGKRHTHTSRGMRKPLDLKRQRLVGYASGTEVWEDARRRSLP